MIALSWRQHRLSLAAAAVLLCGLAVYLVQNGDQLTSYMRQTGLSACLADHGNCDASSTIFTNHYGGVPFAFNIAVFLLPLLIGLFWGAPLVARETELGTHRLIWTQSISRGRWLSVKLATFMPAVVLSAA